MAGRRRFRIVNQFGHDWATSQTGSCGKKPGLDRDSAVRFFRQDAVIRISFSRIRTF
jgi:hypothetical protein